MSTPSDRPDGIPANGHSATRPRLVAGVDGSAGARACLLWALGEAARRGAELEVVGAVPVDVYWPDPYLVDAGRIDAFRADTAARASALVEEIRRDPAAAGSSGVPVRVEVHMGPAAEILVQQAEGADLLVVGSRGRSGTRSTLLGSVALHCVVHASVPVMVVHAETAERPAVPLATAVRG